MARMSQTEESADEKFSTWAAGGSLALRLSSSRPAGVALAVGFPARAPGQIHAIPSSAPARPSATTTPRRSPARSRASRSTARTPSIPGQQPAYKDNGDGTVSDLNTGLMWVKARGAKVTWDAAVAGAAACRVGGHNDWRMPTIKELYSLINFTGGFHFTAADSMPYLDTKYLRLRLRRRSRRASAAIDCQDWSATQYVGTTMNGNPTVFGVNFADGRIKGYPKIRRGPAARGRIELYVRYVRGNPDYGKNDFHDNGDGTITDRATGLMWSKADSGKGMNWEAALAWVQAKNAEKYLGHDDWRLPNAKELQSIVDYTRAPAVTHSPAIDPLFQITQAQRRRVSVLLVQHDPPGRPARPARRRRRLRRLRPRPGLDAVPAGIGRLPPARRPRRGRAAQRSQKRRSRRLPAWPRTARRRYPHPQLRPPGSRRGEMTRAPGLAGRC